MINFYYWGVQCPYNHVNIKILKEIEKEYSLKINYIDITNRPDLAKEINLYSPTLTVFDNKLRWTGPISKDLIVKYIDGNIKKRKPYIVKSENVTVKGTLKFLIPNICEDIKGLCCPSSCNSSSGMKGRWISNIMNKYELEHLGILHYSNGQCVGGAEFIPSLEVPYNIPKGKEIAFLTCVYASDPKYDFKSYPLEILEEELKKLGYTKIYAIASEEVAFPNGPLEWFIMKGYKDLKRLYFEENDSAYQHLIEKELL